MIYKIRKNAEKLVRNRYFILITIIGFSIISGIHSNKFPYVCGMLFALTQFINILPIFFPKERNHNTHDHLPTFIWHDNGIDNGFRIRFCPECEILELWKITKPHNSRIEAPVRSPVKKVSDTKFEVINGGKK